MQPRGGTREESPNATNRVNHQAGCVVRPTQPEASWVFDMLTPCGNPFTLRLPVRLFLFLLCIGLSSCASPHHIIQDLRTLPQDCLFYPGADDSTPLIDDAQRAALNVEYNRRYFSPWHSEKPLVGREDLKTELEKFRKNPGYGENKRSHSSDWVNSVAAAADLESYPNAGFRAITTDNSDLRLLPTRKPLFQGIDTAGGGYPFDELQNSAIHANTPVFVTHVSADKSWLYVESHSGSGWIPAREVAKVDEAFVSHWESGRYAAVLKDETAICDEKGLFLFSANIGSRFPLVGKDGDSLLILAALPDENRGAKASVVRISDTRACTCPLELTRRNVALLANQFMGKPYGWGGMYQDRDCSSTLKDLFSPFGIWLPRHSRHQALEGGTFVELSGLDAAAKEREILKESAPFLTLLWIKGHIMLYIGEYQGEGLVFHSMWGIRTRTMFGQEGRNIIGQAVVTTLHPGADLVDRDPGSGDLLDKVEGMTFLVPKGPPPAGG